MSVENGILEWLHKTGYPLELRTGRRFQEADWHVNYSRWYREGDKARELDLQVLVGAVTPKTASIFLSLCAECKSSRDKPWIGLSSGSRLGENGCLSFASGSLTSITLVGAKAESVQLPDILPAATIRVGGLVQAFGGRPDDHNPTSPYSALVQARSAAIALDRDYRVLAKSAWPQISTASVFFPMVIVEGQLFEYSIDANLGEKLTEVDVLVASVAGDAERGDALVPVMTESYAQRVAKDLNQLTHGFCVAMLPHASKIAAALQFEDLDKRPKADIRASLITTGDGVRLVIENVGEGPATSVDFHFPKPEQNPLPTEERRAKLPIPRLDPGRAVPFLVALAMGRWPPFDIVLTWNDPDGTAQEREEILYEPM